MYWCDAANSAAIWSLSSSMNRWAGICWGPYLHGAFEGELAGGAALGPLDLDLAGDDVGAEDKDGGGDLRADRLPRRVDAEPHAPPVRELAADGGEWHPAGALHDAHGLADHHDEHEADHHAGDDEHLLVGKLALEEEGAGRDAEHEQQTEPGALDDRRGPGAELQRLEEQHSLETLAVDGGQAE